MASTSLPPEQGSPLTAVRAALPSLRPAERRIAELVLTDPDAFARSSIVAVAAEAETSTTTVARFHNRIGYAHFRDFRHDLAQEIAREQLTASEFSVGVADISRGDGLEQVIAKVARDETLSIAQTAEILDVGELTRAVTALVTASRTDVFGVGASAIVSRDLQRKLTRIGRSAIDWDDTHAAWTAAAVLGADAVAIGISHSGETSDTVEFLRLARASGAVTIAISATPDSPLSRQADIVLRTSVRETALRSGALGSRIAQLMVVDCVFIGVLQADYDRATTAIRVTYDAVRPRKIG